MFSLQEENRQPERQRLVYLHELTVLVSPGGGREEPCTAAKGAWFRPLRTQNPAQQPPPTRAHTPCDKTATTESHLHPERTPTSQTAHVHGSIHGGDWFGHQIVTNHHPGTGLLEINLCRHIPLCNLYIKDKYISFICVYIDINTHTHTQTPPHHKARNTHTRKYCKWPWTEI